MIATVLAAVALAFIIYNITTQPNVSSITKLQKELGDGTVETKITAISCEKDDRIIYTVGSQKYEVTLQYNETEIFGFNEDGATENYVIAQWVAKYNEAHPTKTIAFSQKNRYESNIWSYLPMIGMGLLMIVFLIVLFRGMTSQNRQATMFSQSKAEKEEKIKIRFSDVAGADEEKEEVKEVVEFLKNPQKFTAVGAKIPRGILMVGPPGTGKTLLAKAIAGEANVPFFSVSGSDFVEMYVGVGASRVRDLFDKAKQNQPCIIFIDEIDAVGRQRGAGLGGGNDEREQTLNQLLVLMDGFKTNDGIIVMAATNRADVLDPALLRPGRFDRQVYVQLPDVRGREAIFKVHARNKPIGKDADFKKLARITSGFSGAEIANALNEAAIQTAKDNRTVITMEDICEAINKEMMGPKKKSRLVTEVDKRITAYHEAGHAIVSWCLPNNMEVQEVTIIPRGRAAGYTLSRPESDDNHITLSNLKYHLAVDLGGRVAEELVIQDVSGGAVGDIQNATNLARKMVTEWGMSSEIGTVYYGGGQEVFVGRDYGQVQPYSEGTSQKIDAEVKKLIDEAHATATEILSGKLAELDVMARVLISCETIYSPEIDLIMQGKSAEEVEKALEERLSSGPANPNANQ
jgi:cell division protease FtsH